MMDIVSSIATNEIPTTSQPHNTTGVRLRSKVPQSKILDKLKNFAAGGCPINRKIPTKMSRESFIITCQAFKKIADHDRNNKNKYAISTPQGFRTNNRRVCVDCEIGIAVAAEKPFEAPFHITFIELTDLKERPLFKDKPEPEKKSNIKAKPRERGIKLTKKDVIRIRKMHKEGYTVPGLCEIFPVTTSTMYRVVNYESWRNVK